MKEVLDNHAGGTQFANRLKAKMEDGKEITVESMGLHTKAQKANQNPFLLRKLYH